MESRGSVAAYESFPSVRSSKYQKLQSTNEYSVRIWDVKDSFHFPLKRSSLFSPRHGQAYHPRLWQSQNQSGKFSGMSMFTEGLSHQSLLFSPKKQRWQSVDVSYPYPALPFVSTADQASLSCPGVTASPSEREKKRTSLGRPTGSSTQEPTPINSSIASSSTEEKMAFFDNGMQENKSELYAGKRTRQDEEALRSKIKCSLAKRDESYWERRKKNNLSAKRSRDARRLREQQTQGRVTLLEEENMCIRAKINALENENRRLRRIISGHG